MTGAAQAGAGADSDDAMVGLCRGELSERLFSGGVHGESFITAQNIQRQGDRIAVRLELASGEGRKIAGTCIFRDGKLFDVK
jgi:hypothetical protein